MWLFCAFLSVLFTVLSLFLAVKKKKVAQWVSFCALSFTAITVLLEYKLVVDWVCRADWTALQDVTPGMFSILARYVTIQILLNAIALGIRKGSAR